MVALFFCFCLCFFFGKFQTDLKLAEHLTGIFVENVEPIRCVCVCVCVCVRVVFFLFLVLPFLAAPSLLAEEFLLLTSVISVIYVILYKTLYSR